MPSGYPPSNTVERNFAVVSEVTQNLRKQDRKNCIDVTEQHQERLDIGKVLRVPKGNGGKHELDDSGVTVVVRQNRYLFCSSADEDPFPYGYQNIFTYFKISNRKLKTM